MHTELLVSRVGGQVWAALREDGVVVELRVERDGAPSRAGSVLKARVSNIVPAIQSAFLDAGSDRDAFLHVSDLLLPGEPLPDERGSVGVDRDAGPVAGSQATSAARIVPVEDRLETGQELLVQVVREWSRTKGDRVSCHIGLPGRLLVLLPLARSGKVSRRIEDLRERERLAECLDRFRGDEVGFVARTAARGASPAALEAEARRLRETWLEIVQRAASATAPAVLRREPPLPLPLLRDAPPGGYDRVVMDDPDDRDAALRYLERVDPAFGSRIEIHEGPRPLLEAFELVRPIERAMRHRVWLSSGGSVVIEQTEALVSVDVNTGRSVRGRDPEQTILETNLEAAAEIAFQLRLRDLGGIIVIDFIDMAAPASRRRVLEAFEEALRRDPARTTVIGLSELGLLQMTRKRARAGIANAALRVCPLCAGSGRIKRPEIVAGEAIAELIRRVAGTRARPLTVRAHPEVIRALRDDLRVAGGRAPAVPEENLSLVEAPDLDPESFVVE